MNHNIKFTKLSDIDKDGGSLIYLTCKMNGEKVNLIIDTGASRTCIDRSCYDNIIAGTTERILKKNVKTAGVGNNQIKSTLAEIDEIKFNRLIINNFVIVVTDLSNIKAILENKLRIDGVLGNDIFEDYQAVINYQKSTIRFTSL